MVFSILVLGSLGILGVSLIGSSDEAGRDPEVDEGNETRDFNEGDEVDEACDEVELPLTFDEGGNIPFDENVFAGNESVQPSGIERFEASDDVELKVHHENVSGSVAELGVFEVPEQEGLPLPSPDVFKIDLTSSAESDSTNPLDDFNSNSNTPILNINDFDYIDIDIRPEDGSVGILRADYYEKFEDGDGFDLESLHTGVNFYFIPNGDEYPDGYVWSKDSGSLYNGVSYVEDDGDFGKIRLILRVDTGILYNTSSYEAGERFSDEMFERLGDRIIDDEKSLFEVPLVS